MRSIITSERQYTIGFNRVATKEAFGVSIQVTGDKKAKVLREARELLEKALQDAKEVENEVIAES